MNESTNNSRPSKKKKWFVLALLLAVAVAVGLGVYFYYTNRKKVVIKATVKAKDIEELTSIIEKLKEDNKDQNLSVDTKTEFQTNETETNKSDRSITITFNTGTKENPTLIRVEDKNIVLSQNCSPGDFYKIKYINRISKTSSVNDTCQEANKIFNCIDGDFKQDELPTGFIDQSCVYKELSDTDDTDDDTGTGNGTDDDTGTGNGRDDGNDSGNDNGNRSELNKPIITEIGNDGLKGNVKGKAEDATTVRLYKLNSSNGRYDLKTSVGVNVNGLWEIDEVVLDIGENKFKVRAYTPDNVSEFSDVLTVTIADTIPPDPPEIDIIVHEFGTIQNRINIGGTCDDDTVKLILQRKTNIEWVEVGTINQVVSTRWEKDVPLVVEGEENTINTFRAIAVGSNGMESISNEYAVTKNYVQYDISKLPSAEMDGDNDPPQFINPRCGDNTIKTGFHCKEVSALITQIPERVGEQCGWDQTSDSPRGCYLE